MNFEADLKYMFNVKVKNVEWYDEPGGLSKYLDRSVPQILAREKFVDKGEVGRDWFESEMLGVLYNNVVVDFIKEGAAELVEDNGLDGFEIWFFGTWRDSVEMWAWTMTSHSDFNNGLGANDLRVMGKCFVRVEKVQWMEVS